MYKNYSVSLGTKRLENLPLLINTQHYSLFQITIWMQTTLIKDVYHPASYTVMTVDHSLSGVTASKFIDIDCACKLCHLEIVHVLYNLEIGTQSQDSENVQILRLCEHIHRYVAVLRRNQTLHILIGLPSSKG